METVFQVLMPVTLVLVMAGLGLSLTPSDFRRLVSRPVAVTAGLGAQLIILPLVGFGVLWVMPQEPAIAMGALCLVATPGGAVSNLLSHLAEGDTALSVTLTALTSVASLVTVPLILTVGVGLFHDQTALVELEPTKVIAQIVATVLVPIGSGMAVARRWPSFAEAADRPVRILAVVLLVLVIAAGIVANLDTIVESTRRSAEVIIPLCALSMLGGWALAKALRLGGQEALTISIEGGIQNIPLAMTLGGTLLGNPEYTILPGVYSLFSLPMAALWARAVGRRGRSHPMMPSGAP